MPRPKIYQINASPAIIAKINGKHGVTMDDVWSACENFADAAWNDEPTRGRRLFVKGPALNQETLRVVLYPVKGEIGTWNLGTAFRV